MIWTILGMSVAIVAAFCISVSEALVGHPVFEASRPFAAGGLVICGVIAWFVGRALDGKRRQRQEEAKFVLFDFRYWGPMLVTLGIITLFIRQLRTEEAPKAVAVAAPKKAAPVLVVAKAPEPEPPRKPIVFPQMKVQGVIIRQTSPYVIINGQSYTVGDHVGDVVVRAIERSGVMVELGGEMRTLTLN
jgi:hypothetical protein